MPRALAAVRATAAAALSAGALLLTPGAALAGGDHSGPEPAANASRPLPNTTVTTTLDRVTVGFSAQLANLEGHVLTVSDPTGQRVDAGRVDLLDPVTLGVGLKPLARTGTYTVAYTALTQGHSPTGTFTFTYAGPTAQIEEQSAVPTQAALAGGGVLILAGLGAVALRRQQTAAARA